MFYPSHTKISLYNINNYIVFDKTYSINTTSLKIKRRVILLKFYTGRANIHITHPS